MKRLETRGVSGAQRVAGMATTAMLLMLGLGRSGHVQAAAAALASQAPVPVVHIDGAMGPAMSRYLQQALSAAAEAHSPAIVLQLDTPGGLDSAMREMIRAVLASPVPVIGYVAPGGARAASAGTYLLYACALAAMAPATNLGAATPVAIGGEERPSPTQGAAAEPSTAGERKALNDAVAYIRSLAQLHGRNADWAESAVRNAASLPADQALAEHVIDLIAPDVPTLLARVDGRRALAANTAVLLQTAGAPLQQIVPDWRTQLLLFVSHPTIAYGLLLAGIWGLLLEGYHPGAVLPGVVGALALLLALYGLALLQVDYAGLALMALGVGLIVTEFFMPTYGSLGVGGLAAFVIGSIILFSNQGEGLQVALPLIGAVAVAGAVVIAAIAALAARARRAPLATGSESMIGELVEVIGGSDPQWLVRYGGELWKAHSATGLTVGQQARIVRVSELTLWVEPLSRSISASPLPRGNS